MEINTTDIYEAAFYLIKKAEIKAIEGFPVNSKIVCRIYMESPQISGLQALYFQGRAEVNLFEFRRAYQQISAYMNDARKKLKKHQVFPGCLGCCCLTKKGAFIS